MGRCQRARPWHGHGRRSVTLDASRDYVLGASRVSSADHLGVSKQRLSLSPVWAFQLGRFRIATTRASSLLSVGGAKRWTRA